MKTSIWDILTGITLLGILCMIGGFGVIMINPASALNPFRPAAPLTVPTIALPTPANTPTPGLPPTWTPTPSRAPATVVSGESTSSEGTTTEGSGLAPSSTPQPTNTIFVLPTFTPSKTPRAGIGGGSCQVVYQNPADNTKLPKSSDFDMRWTLKNTSSKTWAADSTDIRFLSGDRVHIGNDVRDFPYDVAPQGMIDVIITMRTPLTPGNYVTNWSLTQGNASVCRFYVQFSVE